MMREPYDTIGPDWEQHTLQMDILLRRALGPDVDDRLDRLIEERGGEEYRAAAIRRCCEAWVKDKK